MTPTTTRLSLLSLTLAACSATPPTPFPTWSADLDDNPVILVGDLQRTSCPELLIGREDNDAVRPRLIQAIADDHPSALFLLGDMVFDGSDEDDWRYFDALMTPLRHTPLLPVLGNHDYWGLDTTAIENLTARLRLPQHTTWYTVSHNQVAWIVLDSNQDAFDDAAWDLQRRWFAQTLAGYEADTATRGIVVLLHHPPFTNSAVTGDEEHVQRAFLPAFTRSPLTLAMISGHAHTYERFASGGKMFIVSGGGGGPRVTLLQGDERRHRDDLVHTPAPRPFHYIQAAPTDAGLRFAVKGFAGEDDPLRVLDTFTLPWPAAKDGSPQLDPASHR